MIDQRTAIVHDWFQGFHGSERVVETIRRQLFAPGNAPDVFTFAAARELLPPELARAIVQESRLSRLPGVRQRGDSFGRWRLFLPYMPTYFDRLDLDRYDLVISSSHAFATRVRTRADAVHVCYCYTPARYLWLHDVDPSRAGRLASLALRFDKDRLRRLDREASDRPDGYVAISQAVRDRVRVFYGREAEVIHPPVDIADFQRDADEERSDFLWIGRLVPYKRPDAVVELFRNLPFRLTMIGVGPLEARLRADLPANVELLGWVGRDELVERLRRARALVHLAEDDFGMVMVEALAAGTPVIALERGGALDIVRPGEDGILVGQGIAEQRHAIEVVAARGWDRSLLAERAQLFSPERFVERFGLFVARLQAAAARSSSSSNPAAERSQE